MRKIKILLLSLCALCLHASLFAKSKDNSEIKKEKVSLDAQTSLTSDQSHVYGQLKEKLDKDFKKIIQECKAENKSYWVKKYNAFRNLWKQLISTQMKMNQAGATLNTSKVESDKTYRLATLQVLRPMASSFYQTWTGLRGLLIKDHLPTELPPIESATWVWEENTVIKSMLLSHSRVSH